MKQDDSDSGSSRFPVRNPLAWHITFGTYGTRLHGDSRGTVDPRRNRPGTPTEAVDPRRVVGNATRRAGNGVWLSREQCEWIEGGLTELCVSLEMRSFAHAAAPNHVHLLARIRPEVDGKVAMRLIKRGLSQGLNRGFGRSPVRWWAEGGSTIPVLSPEYLERALDYVGSQSTDRLSQRGWNPGG